MQNYISEGDVISVTAPYALSSGDGCQVGKLFGVAVKDYDSAATAQIKTLGVFDLAKVSAQAWTAGQAVYWDNSAKKATTATTSPNIWIGVATTAAANPSSTGRVRLNGFPIQDPETSSG